MSTNSIVSTAAMLAAAAEKAGGPLLAFADGQPASIWGQAELRSRAYVLAEKVRELRAELDAFPAATPPAQGPVTVEEIRAILDRSIPGESTGPACAIAALVAARTNLVVLCGSTRFAEEEREVYARLCFEGRVVLSHSGRRVQDDALKDRLDALHMDKIRMAAEIWVVDPGGYVGESTAREIAFAESLGRPVRYVSREHPEWLARAALVAPVQGSVTVKEIADLMARFGMRSAIHTSLSIAIAALVAKRTTPVRGPVTLAGITALLAAPEAWRGIVEEVVSLDGSFCPGDELWKAAVAAYADERARTIVAVQLANEQADRAEQADYRAAVEALCVAAESAVPLTQQVLLRPQNGNPLTAAIARVRAHYTKQGVPR